MMRVPPRTAANVLLVLLGALFVFHALILLGALPADLVWGGRVEGSPGDRIALETVGLTVTLLFALLTAAKAGYLKGPGLARVAGAGVWVMFAYFLLNLVGNLLSASPLEKAIFAPASVILAVFAFFLAIGRTPDGAKRGGGDEPS